MTIFVFTVISDQCWNADARGPWKLCEGFPDDKSAG